MNDLTTTIEGAPDAETSGDPAALASDGNALEGRTADTDQALIAELQARVAELETANGVLETEKAALADKLAAADKTPKAKAERAPKLRKLGELDGEPLSPADLLELIRAADVVEVAFGDGKRELAAIPARRISGEAWGITVAGLLLRGVDIELSGLPAPVEIAGYGLFLDGELTAYRKRSDVLRIAPGSRVSLAGDIVF